jgi:uncharacterized OsmC-like protein
MFQPSKASFHEPLTEFGPVELSARHAQLSDAFQSDPCHAMVTDEAHTSSDGVSANDALHTQVTPGDYGHAPIAVGVHERVGGNHDFANPGEILCAAIAACYDSCVRLISCRLGVELRALSVKVAGHVDVRGTLKLEPDVPVGFQGFTLMVNIDAGPGIPETTVKAILKAAEESCVVMQTIRQSPAIEVLPEIQGTS